MSKPPLSVLVAAALDPVFAESPFAAGQAGVPWRRDVDAGQPDWPTGSGSVIWCASYRQLRHAQPGLPQAHGQDDEPLGCVDFTLEFDRSGSLVRADLEGHSLAATFRMLGLTAEAKAAAGLVGEAAPDACRALGDLLTVLLRRTAASA